MTVKQNLPPKPTASNAPPSNPPPTAPEPAPQPVFSTNPHYFGGGVPIPMAQFIPANGFAGFAQQTPAVQALYRGGRRKATRGRRRKTAKKAAAAPRRKRRAAKSGNRFTKGSAAAKRHMAKLRKMRRR